jgi:DNA-binding transcriptional LysR family regulator
MSGPVAGIIAFMGPFHPAAREGIQQPPGWFDNHVDLDLAQVRAFVAVADEAHFGRAAELLSVSQQGLSKRIARLEAQLGVRLLIRGVQGVTLTEAGQRFLAPARRLVAAGDAASAAAVGEERPLRLDVWGHLFGPMRTVQQVLDHDPGLRIEPGAARDLPAVISALGRDEIDAGFGRVPGDAALAHRLVRLEPVDAVLSAGHKLAGRDELRPADLRDSTLIFPAAGERLDFLTRFADQFGIGSRSYGPNLGLGHLLDRVRNQAGGFTLLPADADLPAGVRTVPLSGPVPLYAWSLIWRRDDQHPAMPVLLDAFAETGRALRWVEYRPEADWLPTAPADLPHLPARPAPARRPGRQ